MRNPSLQPPLSYKCKIENILQSFTPFLLVDKETVVREGFKSNPSPFPSRKANNLFYVANVKKSLPFRVADNQYFKCAKVKPFI